MSWDKNTIIQSEVDTIIGLLKELDIPYTVKELDKVVGMGLNDTLCFDDKQYPIRRLEYRDTVILERMIRTSDCDMDDVLVSTKFNKKEEPKNWEFEITPDSRGE